MATKEIKKETKKEVKKEEPHVFKDPFSNRLNLRCQRDRPRVRQVKVS